MPIIAPAAYPALDAVKKGYGSSEANFEASEDTVLYSVAQTFYAAAVCRRGAAGPGVGDQRGAGDAGQRAEPLLRRHRHQGRRRPRRAGAGARQAEGARRPLRARAVVPRARHADPGRRAVQGGAAETLPPPRQTESRHGAAPAPGVPRRSSCRRNLSDAQRRAYAWQWAPTLSAFAKAHLGNYVGFTGDNYAWSVGAQLDWTLFDGGTRDAQRHLAAAQAAQAEAQAAVLTDCIRDDLANNRSLLDTQTGGGEGRAAGRRCWRLETLELVRSQYEAGTVTQIDLLAAQDNLVIAQESLARHASTWRSPIWPCGERGHVSTALTRGCLPRAELRPVSLRREEQAADVLAVRSVTSAAPPRARPTSGPRAHTGRRRTG